jgi:ATP-dependent Clp protease adaptor protein ClpS
MGLKPAKRPLFSAYAKSCVASLNGYNLLMAHKFDSDSGNGTILEEKKAKVKPPPMYKVMLLNDDYTPMEFVVSTIQKFFSKSREQATQIMLKVHREGMGVCGIYPKDVAGTKVDLVTQHARAHQHPLQCTMDEIE